MEPEGGKEEKNRGEGTASGLRFHVWERGKMIDGQAGPARTSNTSQCQHDITRSGLSGDGCSGRGVQRGRKKREINKTTSTKLL